MHHRLINGIDQEINGINRLIRGINRLINCIYWPINRINRFIKELTAGGAARAQGRRRAGEWVGCPALAPGPLPSHELAD